MSPRPAKTVRPDDLAAVRIGIAGPEQIRAWSSGEVRHADTLNYRTGRPVTGGLFCEQIFGPEKDWQCACGKLRGLRCKGRTCPRCEVQVGPRTVRRQRMGHIELAIPVVHVWFHKGCPSLLAHLLDLKSADLERIVYYQDHVVTDPGPTALAPGQLLPGESLDQVRREHGHTFLTESGGEAILYLLRQLDLSSLSRQLRTELDTAPTPSRERQKALRRRLRIVESLLHSGNQPVWMVLRCLPIIPPDLRPILRLPTGRYACSDLNDLYRRIIARNLRLRKLHEMHAPEVILRCEKRLLQQAVAALFDNGKLHRPLRGSNGRPLASLADLIKGKDGRFRENLLGKRVDYSARSVIVVAPELKLHQCGLPKKIALELFQPFIVRHLLDTGQAGSVHRAKKFWKRRDDCVWDALEEVMKGHPVLLNRAPTLHRLGIQAFEPLLTEGNAIRLHPLVCKAFNADFDGDQMAVHLPLSVQAQAEARTRLLAPCNLLNPANGRPIVIPTQDMVLGCYYLTAAGTNPDARAPAFTGPQEVFTALDAGKLDLHAPIEVRLPPDRPVIVEEAGALVQAPRPGDRIRTTAGRLLFDEALPKGMPFYNAALTAHHLAHLVRDCRERLGPEATVKLLEQIKALGFRAATRSGASIAVSDLARPSNKEAVLERARNEADKIARQHVAGNLTDRERGERILSVWSAATDAIGNGVFATLAGEGEANPVHLMVRSGARGNREQVRQLAGCAG